MGSGQMASRDGTVTSATCRVPRRKLGQYLWNETLASAACNKNTRFAVSSQNPTLLIPWELHTVVWNVWMNTPCCIPATNSLMLLSHACCPVLWNAATEAFSYMKQGKNKDTSVTRCQFNQLKTCRLENINIPWIITAIKWKTSISKKNPRWRTEEVRGAGRNTSDLRRSSCVCVR